MPLSKPLTLKPASWPTSSISIKVVSGFEGLRLLGAGALPLIHLNDYPAEPGRAAVKDSDRIYPGDGVAPLGQILRELRQVAPTIALSLRSFDAEYWKGDPLAVAKIGLAKMKATAA